MDTNLKGVLMLSRASIPHMKERGGNIVNIWLLRAASKKCGHKSARY